MSKDNKNNRQVAAGKSEPPNEQDEAIRAALADLSPRWRQFVEVYCTNGFNGTAAYIAAGYKPKGAMSAASRLLRNVKVARARDLLLAASQMSVAELLSRISDDATATMLPFLKVEETTRGQHTRHQLRIDFSTPEAQAALRWVRRVKIEQTKWGEQVSFELVDDQRAKDMLARAHKLFVDRQEISVSGVTAPESYIPDNGRGPKKEGA
jgi:phage terminase small subunit